jgi:pilus assembly protein CpaE
MTLNPLAKIHVLVLRDELPVLGYQSAETQQIETILEQDPRLRVTTARAGYGEAVRAAQRHRPDVILIDAILGDPVELVAELDEALQKLPVMVILDEVDRDRAHDCVVTGARGCLVRPVDPNTLSQTIVQVHERAVRRRKQLEAEAEAAGRKRGGRVIAVRGAKGGVGATVVATNLAVAIKRQTGQRVALVDANFYGGDALVALNLTAEATISDLIAHVHVLDDELLNSTMVAHESGVQVLASPAELERAEAIRADEFQRVIEALRLRFEHVVIDCSPFFDPNSLTALDQADVLLLLSTPEIVSLKNAARFIQLGAELGYPDTKLRLVINRHKSKGAIKPSEFERHLEYRASFNLPNDNAVVGALTRGEPLFTYQRGSSAARSIERLARAVVSGEGWSGAPSPPGRGRFRLTMPRLFPGARTLKPGQEQA